ncbi:MAG: ABC transporter ATP-binding protein [Acidimicrobiales bacterium]|jgi:oligopeptide/dipeptide ABC transporter ATP-binding protein
MPHLLEVQGLSVAYDTQDGVVQAVDDVSFFVDPGEVLCLVGESGSGKSVTCMTIMGLTRATNARFGGTACFGDVDLLQANERKLQAIRGNEIALIPQDPMSALNPVQRIGNQIVEQIRAHERVSKSAARDRMVELLTRVGIPRAKERSRSFVHEFSGGMRQRVMIAMALSCSPQLIVADEPTTALDVTVQAQILSELAGLCRQTGVSLLLVTHDFGVVAEMADRVVVMYGGRVVEEAPVTELFEDPQHPYTWGLLGSVPRADRPRSERLPMIAGSAPSPLHPPRGCHFGPRCPHQFGRCCDVPPLAARVDGRPEHRDRCWLGPDDKRRLRIVDGAVGLGTPDDLGLALS